MKIIYFGTSEIGVPILQKLLQHHDVVAVVTSPDKAVGRKQVLTPSPIAHLAQRERLTIYKPDKVKNNPDFLHTLKQHAADLYVVVSYGKILPLELLDQPPLKTINVHFSLLPKYRGPAPVQFTLLNGETKTGTSIFILDELVDHGPLLATAELNIEPDDTNLTLQSKLAQLSADLLIDTLPKYEHSQITPVAQNHEEATSTKIITKEDGKVNWQETNQQIYNRFRAFQPWPGIYTSWEGKTLKIIDCAPSSESVPLHPGQVQHNLVGCGNNTILSLKTVQLEGKNPTSITDFLNGHPQFGSGQLN